MSTSYSLTTPSSQGDTSIKLSPEKSILKRRVGDDIRLTEAEFLRISEAFFEELERKFTE